MEQLNMKAMQYTIIRFMPHVQTREFANIGVIAACPKTGYFDYKIESRYSRLSHFFKYFNAEVFRQSLIAFEMELKRVQDNLHYATPSQIQVATEHLAQPRETILQTNGISVCMAADEATQLQTLFDYYIHCSFAKQQPEELLTRQIVEIVKSFHTPIPFIETKLGNDEYHVSLPLVQQQGKQVHKIIKPLYLAQKDASEIYRKADNWLARFKRLRDFGWINQDTAILLPYKAAYDPSNSQNQALKRVLSEFKQHGIAHTSQDDLDFIHKFSVHFG